MVQVLKLGRFLWMFLSRNMWKMLAKLLWSILFKNFWTSLCTTIGFAFVGYGFFLQSRVNWNSGTLAIFVIGAAFLIWPWLVRLLRGAWKKVAVVIPLVCMLLVGVAVWLLLWYGEKDTATGEETVLVVLGAGIKGDSLTKTLRHRLDEAIDYYEDNPDIMIVVSGGQGPNETITEAEAMEKYLLANGIPLTAIIREEESTSTYENFTYTKQMLDSKFDKDTEICFVTSEYHVFRAEKLAKDAGFETTNHRSSETIGYLVLPNCLRECAAIVQYVITGK